jgi:RNA 3'-terminal phosphate cyclase
VAVAEGRSKIHVSEITMHTLTNIKVAELIVGSRFDLQGDLKKPGSIVVDGIGLRT